MKELFNAAISLPNILPTALLGLVLLYWLTVVVGALDFDFLDFDVDTDVDTDVDVDVDVNPAVDSDVSINSEVSFSWLNSILVFFNIGKVPFMLFLTTLVLPLWVVSVMTNHYVGIDSFLGGLIVLVPAFFVSLFLAKFLTLPFVKLFEHMQKEDSESKTAIGKICVVSTLITEKKIGQAQIATSGSPLLLNVITSAGHELKSGDTALVIEYLKDRNLYLVAPYLMDNGQLTMDN